MGTVHLTKSVLQKWRTKIKVWSLGTKSNPITSQRISASVQFPNGGILLPEHDNVSCIIREGQWFRATDRQTGRDAACYVQPSLSLPRFWLKSVRQIEERENTRIHMQLLTKRKQDRNEIILCGAVGWKRLMKHIYKPPPIHFAFVWLQIRIQTTQINSLELIAWVKGVQATRKTWVPFLSSGRLVTNRLNLMSCDSDCVGCRPAWVRTETRCVCTRCPSVYLSVCGGVGD